MREPNGLLAASYELTPDQVVMAYRQGIFPWFNPGEPVLWWSPDPRMVLRPDHIRISRSLKKRIRHKDYEVRLNSAFGQVMRACAEPRPGQAGTWIGKAMLQVYTDLHRQGHAHSVEIWMNDGLVGGLYGLTIGRVFYGESMFSRQTDASKLALAHLCLTLQRCGYEMIDCQMETQHLASMGASPISRDAFVEELGMLVDREPGVRLADLTILDEWEVSA